MGAGTLSAGGPAAMSSVLAGGRGGDFFPSPWMDAATQAMPEQNKNALEWSEYIFNANGTYRMAMERIISYFLTDLDISSADKRKPLGDDEKEQWVSILSETLSVTEGIQSLDRDEACYGNGFMSLVVPFKRFLLSPFAPIEFSFRKMAENPGTFNLQYDASRNQFTATCPQTGKRGAWKIDDRPDDLDRKLRLKVWSPHEIEIVYDYWSNDCAYIWKIPEEYKKEIRRGNMYMLERAPVEVLKAVQEDGWYLFAADALFHLKQPTISGIRTRGWGLSRTLVNFRDVWYVQVLRRYNEAIALDYIIPFRLITPTQRSGSGGGIESADPLRMLNGGQMRGQVNSMLRKRRRDPASWHFLPFPVDYQALGGDAQQLAPSELLEQAYDVMLNSAGTPTELYRGTLQLQTAPVSLRLFEATHHSVVHGNNRCLSWIVNQVSQLLTLPVVQARMKRVTHADDFNVQMAALQLFMGQQLSGSTAFSGLSFDWKDEQRRIAEEASYQQQLQAELQEEMQQSAFGSQIAKGQTSQPGAPAGGGAAAGGQVDPATGAPIASPVSGFLAGPTVPTTPQDMLAQAEMLAQELLGLPESQKDSELRQLKQKNQVLHSLVKAQMDSMRQQARTAGGAMLLGQTGAQPAM